MFDVPPRGLFECRELWRFQVGQSRPQPLRGTDANTSATNAAPRRDMPRHAASSVCRGRFRTGRCTDWSLPAHPVSSAHERSLLATQRREARHALGGSSADLGAVPGIGSAAYSEPSRCRAAGCPKRPGRPPECKKTVVSPGRIVPSFTAATRPAIARPV